MGSGAVFFYLQDKYKFENVTLCDVNKDLVLCYVVVQHQVEKLVDQLEIIENEYLALTEEKRKEYFYDVRKHYNFEKNRNYTLTLITGSLINRAAQTIFLNKTCFNGLYRLNKKGEYNVPFGRYKKPSIVRRDVLVAASHALKNVEIICGDFECIKNKILEQVFIYYDPPYRPISKTASFTAYSKFKFTDVDQQRLLHFMDEVDKPNVYQMLSNSDPKGKNDEDNYFDDLYTRYSINRVRATRMINSKGSNRGAVNELLITNYECAGV